MVSPIEAEVPREALDVIQTYGRTVTWNVPTRVPDTTAGSVTKTQVPHTIKVSPPKHTNRWKNGDLTEEGMTVVFIPSQSLAFTPEKGQTMVSAGVTFGVTDTDTLASGEGIVGFKCLMRQA